MRQRRIPLKTLSAKSVQTFTMYLHPYLTLYSNHTRIDSHIICKWNNIHPGLQIVLRPQSSLFNPVRTAGLLWFINKQQLLCQPLPPLWLIFLLYFHLFYLYIFPLSRMEKIRVLTSIFVLESSANSLDHIKYIIRIWILKCFSFWIIAKFPLFLFSRDTFLLHLFIFWI